METDTSQALPEPVEVMVPAFLLKMDVVWEKLSLRTQGEIIRGLTVGQDARDDVSRDFQRALDLYTRIIVGDRELQALNKNKSTAHIITSLVLSDRAVSIKVRVAGNDLTFAESLDVFPSPTLKAQIALLCG